eukprot:2285882-Ditylum_brightwellii.AAC.1
MSGDLVSIHSAYEEDYLTDKYSGSWVGWTTDPQKICHNSWCDGSQFDYSGLFIPESGRVPTWQSKVAGYVSGEWLFNDWNAICSSHRITRIGVRHGHVIDGIKTYYIDGF